MDGDAQVGPDSDIPRRRHSHPLDIRANSKLIAWPAWVLNCAILPQASRVSASLELQPANADTTSFCSPAPNVVLFGMFAVLRSKYNARTLRFVMNVQVHEYTPSHSPPSNHIRLRLLR